MQTIIIILATTGLSFFAVAYIILATCYAE